MTNNLNRTPVAASQGSTVFDAIENSTGAVDAKVTETLTVSVNSTSMSLTAAQMRGNAGFLLNTGSPAPGGAVTLTVAAVEIGRFTVVNNTSQTVTVTIASQPVTAPIVSAGRSESFISDGVNVRSAESYAVKSADVTKIVEISQAAYDALSPIDSETLYVITS